MRFCFRATAVLMLAAWALPAVVGQTPGSGGPSRPIPGGPDGPQAAKPQLKMKVFKLERGDPEALIHYLTSLLEAPDVETNPPQVVGGGRGIGVPQGPGGPQPGGPGSGFGGVPPPAGGALGGGGLGFGGIPQGGIGCFLGSPVNATPVWRATTHARTRAVVVRGSDRHLTVAADLVAILDRPSNAPLPKLQVVKAFTLKHASAEELAEVISALSFDDVKVATPGEHLLAVVAPDDVAGSVAELVKELDVPDKGDAKPKRNKPQE